MIESATRASAAKDLEQQKSDFTAEGAPAPGKSRAILPSRATRVTRVRSNGPVTTPVLPDPPLWGHTRPLALA
jgi:hypothetical protein